MDVLVCGKIEQNKKGKLCHNENRYKYEIIMNDTIEQQDKIEIEESRMDYKEELGPVDIGFVRAQEERVSTWTPLCNSCRKSKEGMRKESNYHSHFSKLVWTW